MDRERIGQFIDATVQDPARARELLRAHPDLLEARWLHGETPLHFLAVEGYLDAVRFLAEAGVAVDATNEFGDTALHDVAMMGNVEVARILLAHGADPNARSETRETALAAAVFSGSHELVELLLEAGAETADYRGLEDAAWEWIAPNPSTRPAIRDLIARRSGSR